MGYLKPKGAGLVVDLKNADEYEAPKPFKRFMKVLIDDESFPGAPLCIATPRYPPGAKCPFHVHEGSVKVYFILEGELLVTVQGKKYLVKKGQLIYIPPMNEHRAENRGRKTCRFVATHAPAVKDVQEVKQTWKKIARRR